MSDIAATLQTLLHNSPSGYARIVKTIRRTLEDGEQAQNPLETAHRRIALRLGLVLTAFAEGEAGYNDVAVLMRQAIRTLGHRLPLPVSVWATLRDSAPASQSDGGRRAPWLCVVSSRPLDPGIAAWV